jgi:hypothetical protein
MSSKRCKAKNDARQRLKVPCDVFNFQVVRLDPSPIFVGNIHLTSSEVGGKARNWTWCSNTASQYGVLPTFRVGGSPKFESWRPSKILDNVFSLEIIWLAVSTHLMMSIFLESLPAVSWPKGVLGLSRTKLLTKKKERTSLYSSWRGDYESDVVY